MTTLFDNYTSAYWDAYSEAEENNNLDDLFYEEEILWKDMKDILQKLCPFIAQGSVGHWNGNFEAGTIVYDIDDFFYRGFKDCDYFLVEYNKQEVLVLGCHHDGTNTYHLKPLSQKGLDAIDSYEEYGRFYHKFESIREFHEALFNKKGYTKLVRLDR